MKVAASLAFAVATVVSTVAQAEYTGGVVKIGVLSDMSSVYADLTGAGSVAAAKLAVQDFDPASHGMKVEIISADHQNKPDIGSNITRQWFDVDGVDVVVDVPTSSVAFAVSDLAREKNKVFLASGDGLLRPHWAEMLTEHCPLDLRHMDACARYGRGGYEIGRRYLVLSNR